MATDANKLAKTSAPGALALPFDYGETANAGWEGTSSSDFAIPFLSVLQSGSPQVKKQKAEYIEGAQEGMLLNTASNEIIDGTTGVTIVPCYTEHIFIEWKNRQKDTGGFIGIHQPDSDVVKRAVAASTQYGKYTVPVDGGIDHDLVETFMIYCILVDADGEIEGPCMISFASTKIKAYKNTLTPLRKIKGRPPLFAFKLKVTTVFETRSKGDSWNFKIVPANGSPVDSLIDPAGTLFAAGKEFKEQVESGKAKVDHSKANGGGGGGAGGDAEDAPF